MPAPDSVSLEEAAGEESNHDDKFWRKKTARPRPRAANLKIVISLFLIFVLVVSDVFTDSIIGGFRGAVRCRTPTSWGVCLQGLFVSLFFILAVHLIDAGVI